MDAGAKDPPPKNPPPMQPPATSYFDKAERDRIRGKLLRYMEDNRIGVPRLLQLIMDANDLKPRRDGKLPIAQSSLQRFLGDAHRTNEALVAFCAKFAEDLPADDPLTTLGEALTTFMQGKGGQSSLQAFAEAVIGTYDGTVNKLRNHMFILGHTVPEVPYSRLVIGPRITGSFATVHETVHEGQLLDGSPNPAMWRVYEGVILQPGRQMFALMRNVLTGSARTYSLTSYLEDGPLGSVLRGRAEDADGLPEQAWGITRASGALAVLFIKTAEETAP